MTQDPVGAADPRNADVYTVLDELSDLVEAAQAVAHRLRQLPEHLGLAAVQTIVFGDDLAASRDHGGRAVDGDHATGRLPGPLADRERRGAKRPDGPGRLR